MTYLIFLAGVFTGVFLNCILLSLAADKEEKRVYVDRHVCPKCDRWLTIEEASRRNCRCGVEW